MLGQACGGKDLAAQVPAADAAVRLLEVVEQVGELAPEGRALVVVGPSGHPRGQGHVLETRALGVLTRVHRLLGVSPE
jgi:hypothetical protein